MPIKYRTKNKEAKARHAHREEEAEEKPRGFDLDLPGSITINGEKKRHKDIAKTVHVFPQLLTSVIFDKISGKPENQMTALEKMKMADKGLTKKELEQLKEKTALDYDELAKALSVGRATLINKKGKDKFTPALSEKIVGLADLYSYGYEVFEDKLRFNEWMFRPSQALGGQIPYNLIHNQFGREEVRNVIGRIEYGVYS